jgi:hypothetical protein
VRGNGQKAGEALSVQSSLFVMRYLHEAHKTDTQRRYLLTRMFFLQNYSEGF